MLGVLLTNSGSVVSTDRLIDEIWGDDVALERQNTLWVHISNLRKVLEPEHESRSGGGPLQTRSPGYVLDVDSIELDSDDFERLLVEGRALTETDPAAASIVFAEALALWRGSAYADFVYEPWAQNEISRLEELRLEAVESRIDADIRRGMTHELVGELESLVREHPTRERLAGALMLTLYRSGRPADALRSYRLSRQRLVDELGVEPSAALQRLNERIVKGDPSLDSDHRAARSGSSAAPGLSVRGYEIRERLGERGSGVLYRAFQPAVGREVVIKVIRPDLADDPSFIRRFEDEAQLVARLEHPHIVPLYDYWR
ncbi:MAG: BTAD domain-containing putative transcriptional regulator, partial [Ilumatobacteraceae bacterium]